MKNLNILRKEPKKEMDRQNITWNDQIEGNIISVNLF